MIKSSVKKVSSHARVHSQVFGQRSYKKAVLIELDSCIQTILVGSKKFDIQISEGQKTHVSCIP